MISEEFSYEEKARMISSITKLFAILKHENGGNTFEDLINLSIKKIGINKTKAHFKGLAQSWQLAKLPGYQTLNSDEIYNNAFNNIDVLMDNFMDLNRQLQSQKEETATKSNSQSPLENKVEKEKPKPIFNKWLYNNEKRLRGIWYLIIPLLSGLILEWYCRLPLSSFNWPIFLIISITCLITLILFDEKNRSLLAKINRDIKVVITTILVLLIIAVLALTIDYTNYVAEYLNIKSSDAFGFCSFIYIFIFFIVSLWETPKED